MGTSPEVSNEEHLEKKAKKEAKKKAKKEKKVKKKKSKKTKDDTKDVDKVQKSEVSTKQDIKPTEDSEQEIQVTSHAETMPSTDEDSPTEADKDSDMEKVQDTDAEQKHANYDESEGDERKIFLSRVPAAFDEDSVIRILTKAFGEGSVEHVAFPAKRQEDNDVGDTPMMGQKPRGDESKEHRGFAFVTMSSIEKRNEAIESGTIRGKAKETSKKKHTMYISFISRSRDDDDERNINDGSNVCFLWSKFRCPYGEDCKFQHEGDGGCIEKKDEEKDVDKKNKKKCFTFRTKGKCKLGDECPYSHDFKPKVNCCVVLKKEKKDKDCISWKTKGKCRTGDRCPYRHDEAVREACLAKKQKQAKKRGRNENRQPLSVRVFGLNYDTKEEDVREYFADCGAIKEITFPTYEDSGRSKGYCGVLFTSPKTTEKACELDGQELHGRWLSVQPGKMYQRQWEEREMQRTKTVVEGEGRVQEQDNIQSEVGEFGQKVKRRKKHGFGDD